MTNIEIATNLTERIMKMLDQEKLGFNKPTPYILFLINKDLDQRGYGSESHVEPPAPFPDP